VGIERIVRDGANNKLEIDKRRHAYLGETQPWLTRRARRSCD
jgi:hypothetical protein